MSYQGPGRYRHYKGGEYDVLGLALREATKGTLEEQLDVIYRPLTPGSLLADHDASFWSRPLDDFNGVVPKRSRGLVSPCPRFELIESNDGSKPGQMHPVDSAFYDLVVAQRNRAWQIVDLWRGKIDNFDTKLLIAQALNDEACEQRGLDDRTDWDSLTTQEQAAWLMMASAVLEALKELRS